MEMDKNDFILSRKNESDKYHIIFKKYVHIEMILSYRLNCIKIILF